MTPVPIDGDLYRCPCGVAHVAEHLERDDLCAGCGRPIWPQYLAALTLRSVAAPKTPAPTGAGDHGKDPAVTFETYQPPQYDESDSFPPAENRGKPLIVKVIEHKHITSTKFKPEGGPGVVCDVVDLTTGTKYRRVLWMSGAIVDGLSPYAGRNMLVVSFAAATSKGGNTYTTVQPGDAAMLAYAQQYVAQHGDPFPPELGVPAQPVPAAAPAWQPAPAATPWQAQAPAPQVAAAPVAPVAQVPAPVAPVAQAAPPAVPTAAAPVAQAAAAPAAGGPAPWEAQPAPVAQPAASGVTPPPWETQQ